MLQCTTHAGETEYDDALHSEIRGQTSSIKLIHPSVCSFGLAFLIILEAKPEWT